MQKCVYRNFYYIKESIIDFFKCNKKYLFFSILSIVVGLSIAICIGLNNIGSFNNFNITDKIILAFFTNKSLVSLFLKYAFRYLFLTTLIVIFSSLNYAYIINYFIFGYLSFNVVFNAIIIASMFNLSGILYIILCYLPFLLLCNFILIVVFILCKSANNTCTYNSISNIPIKSIIICYGFIVVILLLFSIISYMFSKFINCLI